jgi:hypothetical protein
MGRVLKYFRGWGGERVVIFGKFLVKGWRGYIFLGQGERRNGVK